MRLKSQWITILGILALIGFACSMEAAEGDAGRRDSSEAVTRSSALELLTVDKYLAADVSHLAIAERDLSPVREGAEPSPPPPPDFVCGGEPCANPRSPKPGDNKAYPSPPRWLTSANAGACVAHAVPGMKIVHDFNQVFQMAPELAQTNGFYDPNYWLIQLKSFANSMTFPECQAWKEELSSGGSRNGGGSW